MHVTAPNAFLNGTERRERTSADENEFRNEKKKTFSRLKMSFRTTKE